MTEKRIKILKLLVYSGAEINATDNKGNTVLHKIAYNCSRWKLYYDTLIELGIDNSIEDKKVILHWT